MKFQRRRVLSGASLLAGGTATLASAKSININDLQLEVDKAVEGGGVLRLPAGNFLTGGLKIKSTLRIEGVPGHTKLTSINGGPIFTISDCDDVSIFGVQFAGKKTTANDDLNQSALVMAFNSQHITIEVCKFEATQFTGLKLVASSGRIVGNQFEKIGLTGIFAFDSRGLEISSNDMTDIGDNGIQIWRTDKSEDGTQILNNRISHVRFDSGGDGQNGNAIMVFKASNVIVAHNRVSDLAYTGIRFNSVGNGQIIGNSISRAGEKAIYSEFAFDGSVISNNTIDEAGFGIAITNFDVGGRLALCTGNMVRNIRRGKTKTADIAVGISAEADSLISNNVVEGVDDSGINLGWANWCRNVTAQGNVVRDCDHAITFSMTEGVGKLLITGNMIMGARLTAIRGYDAYTPKTEDLALEGQTPPAHATINNNIVTR